MNGPNLSLIHNAAYLGNVSVLKLLIKKGVNQNFIDGIFEYSPLHSAVNGNKPAAMEALIKFGATVDIQDKYKKTPLHYACDKAHLAAVKVLIKNGADVNSKDTYGNTPLHYAVHHSKNHEKIINLLLNSGANINAKNKNKNIPLHNAIFENAGDIQYNIVKLLVDKGSNVYSKGLFDMVLMDIIEYQEKDDTKLLSIVKKTKQYNKTSKL